MMGPFKETVTCISGDDMTFMDVEELGNVA